MRTCFLFVDEHDARLGIGATGLLIGSEQYASVRRSVASSHPDAPSVTKPGPTTLARPEELHHCSFLRDHDDEIKLETFQRLVDVALEHRLRIFQHTYRNVMGFIPEQHNVIAKRNNVVMSTSWIVDCALTVMPDALVVPVFDAGMGSVRIDPGFQPDAERAGRSSDTIHLLTVMGVHRSNIVCVDPDRLGEVVFADSKTSDLMQLCDVLGGLLRSHSRTAEGVDDTPFVRQQAELANPLVESGLARVDLSSWTRGEPADVAPSPS